MRGKGRVREGRSVFLVQYVGNPSFNCCDFVSLGGLILVVLCTLFMFCVGVWPNFITIIVIVIVNCSDKVFCPIHDSIRIYFARFKIDFNRFEKNGLIRFSAQANTSQFSDYSVHSVAITVFVGDSYKISVSLNYVSAVRTQSTTIQIRTVISSYVTWNFHVGLTHCEDIVYRF